jgi:L-2-hydroxyglutarate oxidase LhgO
VSDVDVTIVGGGVVGCAVAAAASRRGLTTVVLERADRLGSGTTSRNSEVAHGGMYYPTDSLKARFCARGRRQLRDFCGSVGVPYREIGKLIVAVNGDEQEELEVLLERGRANDVEDLELIGGGALARLEPHVRATAALLSPRTAIFGAEQTAQAYGQLAAEHGGQIFTSAECVGLVRRAAGWQLTVAPPAGAAGVQPWKHTSRFVVNAAGLYADRIARLSGVDIAARGWRLHWVKGNYFTVDPQHSGRVSRLIYPVPPVDGTSLGVHVCLDLAGQVRLGPDFQPLGLSGGIAADGEPVALERLPREDYTVDPKRGDAFFAGAVRYLPFLRRGDLTPAMAGIRPRLREDGFSDFVIVREQDEHLDGLVNLIGIDSPGLTSAPAIADYVVDLLAG